MILCAAGSGTGKTTFVKELAYSLHQQGQRVGLIMLEESNKRTLLGLTGIHMNKNILIDRSETNEDEITSAFDDLFGSGNNPVYLYDHFGINSYKTHAGIWRKFLVSKMCPFNAQKHTKIGPLPVGLLSRIITPSS